MSEDGVRLVAWAELSIAIALIFGQLPWGTLAAIPDAPAWVQAVGSVGAILIAIWIDRGASRRQARQADDARRATLMAASRLVSMLRVKAEATLEGWREKSVATARVGTHTRRGYRLVLDMMERFPIASIPDPGAVMVFADALEQGDLALAFLEEFDELHDRAVRGFHDPAMLMDDIDRFFAPTVKSLIAADEYIRELAEPGWKGRLASR